MLQCWSQQDTVIPDAVNIKVAYKQTNKKAGTGEPDIAQISFILAVNLTDIVSHHSCFMTIPMR